MAIIVLGVFIGAGLLLLAFMLAQQRRMLRAAPPPTPPILPPVSILKPLKGADPELHRNLETFYAQDYPEFEILFGAADHRDTALEAARQVSNDHPNTPTRILVHAPTAGRNPKVENLAPIARRARFPVILVSDSNVAVPPGYLRDLVGRLLQPGVGLVTSPILGVPRGGIGSSLESLQLNTFVMGGVAALNSVPGGVCVVGKSMLLRRKDLDALGGFDFLGGFLAEDQVCGEEMVRRGRRVAVSGIPVHNVLGSFGLRGFASRHLRWARIRARMSPAGYAGELLLNPILIAAGGACALRTPASAALLAATLVLKIALDAAAERVAGGRRPLLHYAVHVPLKDLLIGALWPLGCLGGAVEWRGTRYRIGARTRLEAPAPRPVAVEAGGAPAPSPA